MKTAIVLLGFDGPDGRQAGNIIHIAELPDDAPVYFGRKVKPPNFQIVVLANTRIKDLPATFMDYGYHTSRRHLDYARLESGMDVQLRTKDWVGLNPLAFRLACADRGQDWQPETVTRAPQTVEGSL